MSKWLTIVGMGEGGFGTLAPAARDGVLAADVVVGPERLIAQLPEVAGQIRAPWGQPFSDGLERLVAGRGDGRAVCVLATGDPFDHGAGAALVAHVPIEEMTVFTAPGAFTLASARLGWSRKTVECLSLHGRPFAGFARFVQPGARLLILSNGPETPGLVAEYLNARGFGESAITVFEHMGGDRERRLQGRAADWAFAEIAALNTIAVEIQGRGEAYSRGAALPDDAFEHDGQLTKREVRAATMASLAPMPGQVLWDVGAGCGSIAIEWMRTDPRNRAAAFERAPDRLPLIRLNADALGVPGLQIIAGEAPACLAGAVAPDAVFIGGGITAPGLFDACWAALPTGGRLVANTVTIEGEQAAVRLQAVHGGALSRLEISRAGGVGGFTGWKPFRPVVQWSIGKP